MHMVLFLHTPGGHHTRVGKCTKIRCEVTMVRTAPSAVHTTVTSPHASTDLSPNLQCLVRLLESTHLNQVEFFRGTGRGVLPGGNALCTIGVSDPGICGNVSISRPHACDCLCRKGDS